MFFYNFFEHIILQFLRTCLLQFVGYMDAQRNDSITNTITPLESSEGVKDFNQLPNTNSATQESAFSTSGRLISPHRSRLHPKTLEALMCAQSWLLNEIRGNFVFYINYTSTFY